MASSAPSSRFPAPLRLPVFVGLLTVIEAAREWPIDYIEEYQLERIFGNSERTVEAWSGDRIKSTPDRRRRRQCFWP